jgi:hypothetical protein
MYLSSFTQDVLAFEREDRKRLHIYWAAERIQQEARSTRKHTTYHEDFMLCHLKSNIRATSTIDVLEQNLRFH